MKNGKVVLAYSGGLDTSAMIPWLKENAGLDVIAMLVDVGRVKNIPLLMERALASGAVDTVVVDAKQVFAEHYVLPALMANALYEEKYPLVSSLSRPLIAKKLVETAHKYGAGAVAHGCTGKGNDQVRVEIGVKSQDPHLECLAPARVWGMSREELLDFAAERGIPIPLTKKSPYSIDENLWGRTNECGILEDPWEAPPEDAFEVTVNPLEAPDEAQLVEVGFEQGRPVSLDGTLMDFVELIEAIDADRRRSRFRPCRHDREPSCGHQESRDLRGAGGAGSDHGAQGARGPGAHPRPDPLQAHHRVQARRHDLRGTVVRPAHRCLQGLPVLHAGARDRLGQAALLQGQLHRRGPPVSLTRLYNYKLATYSKEDQFSHDAAAGFAELWGLPIQMWARVGKEHGLHQLEA